MKKVLIYLSVGFSLLGFSIISCQKTSPYLNAAASDTTTTVATTNAGNAQAANDASNASESGVAHPGSPAAQYTNYKNQIQDNGTATSGGSFLTNISFKGALGDSVIITPQGLHSPGIVHSDFGAGVKANGKLRKGVIISHFMKKYFEIGFTDTVTFQNYNVDGNAIAGTIILTRLSDTSIKRVCQLSFTLNGGPTSTYSSSDIKSYSFHAVPTAFHFPTSFTANVSGYSTSRNGGNGSLDTATITHPLQYIFSNDCITGGVFPVKGTIIITSSSFKKARVIDYGTGSCDLTFTITIGTTVKTITLASSTK